MIIVIADDFTGSAEIAGIGLRYGLKPVIITNDFDEIDLENFNMLIIDTDTRSISENESYSKMLSITKKIQKIQPKLIYKKVDSLLRGNISQELNAMLDVLPFKYSILIPANPSIGRIIKDNTYLVDGKYIHETILSKDPEFPSTSSFITDMIKGDITVLKPHQYLEQKSPKTRIIVGEATSINDIKLWADSLDKDVLPAGGADFFKAIIEKYEPQQKLPHTKSQMLTAENIKGNILIINGSPISQANLKIKEILSKHNLDALTMPNEIFYDSEIKTEKFEKWSDEIANFIMKYKLALVSTYDKPIIKNKNFEKLLRLKLAKLVSYTLEKVNIKDLFIEGGSTAHAILQELNLTKFLIEMELAPGVVRVKPFNKTLFITVKPGSYDWPDIFIDLLTLKLKN